LYDLRLDFADLLVAKDVDRQFAVEYFLANLGLASRAKRIGLARPAQRRLGLLIGFLKRLIGPPWGKRRVRPDAIEPFEEKPDSAGHISQPLLYVLYWFVHCVLS